MSSFWGAAHKDPENHEYESDEQRIVHDSDAFEIARVLKNPKEEFDVSELAFAKLKEFANFPVEQLCNEIFAFVAVTENEALKTYLEKHSKNYLADLVSVFQALHVKDQRFPLMMKYLQPICTSLASPLSSTVRDLLKI